MANVQDRGPPSAAAIAIATAIVSGLTGYYLGQARSIGVFGKPVAHADESDLSDADAAANGDNKAGESEDDLSLIHI